MSPRRPTPVFLLLVVILAVAVGGCGKSSSPASPSNVASSVSTQPAAPTGTTISGVVAGAGTSASRTAAVGIGLTVAIQGTAISAPVDPGGRFTLQNVPSGTVTLTFAGPGINATLLLTGVGDQQRIEITVTLSGGTASLDKDQRTWPDNKVEIEGKITAIDLVAETFTIGDKVVAVTPATVMRHGSTAVALAGLKVGDRVHVKGAPSGDTVTALEVLVQNQNGTPSETVVLTGPVSGLSGACPMIMFAVQGTPVAGTPSTAYPNASCGAVQNDVPVEVRGVLQADGTLAALSIVIQYAEVRGVLTGLAGTCPAVTFTVGSTTVKATVATAFLHTACGALQNGMKVDAKGFQALDGSITAVSVDAGFFELAGGVVGLGGTCPDLSFTVAGTAVATSSLTSFQNAPCSVVQNGLVVKVRGLMTAGGTIAAVAVEISVLDLSGIVTGGVSGACPAVTFTLNGSGVRSFTTIRTSALTEYVRGSCADLKSGEKPEVRGLELVDGSVLATWIGF